MHISNKSRTKIVKILILARKTRKTDNVDVSLFDLQFLFCLRKLFTAIFWFLFLRFFFISACLIQLEMKQVFINENYLFKSKEEK